MKEINSLDDILTKDGRINSAITRRPWFKETSYYHEVAQFCSTIFSDVLNTPLSQLLYHFDQKCNAIPTCECCGKPALFNPFSKETCVGSYTKTCGSRSCIAKNTTNKRNATMQDRYGALVTKNHTSQCKDKVDNFVKKSKETIISRYGVTNVGQVPSSRIKARNTLIERYGVDKPGFTESAIQKRKLNSINKLNLKCKNSVTISDLIHSKSEEYEHYTSRVEFRCDRCMSTYTMSTETFKWRSFIYGTPCTKCSGVTIGSVPQKELATSIKEFYDGVILENCKTLIAPLEVDIYLPDVGIAIEFNGTFWHSHDSNESEDDKNYHLNKTLKCVDKNVRLIHIFEHDWIINKDKILSRLKGIIKPSRRIYARDCCVDSISVDIERAFLESYHTQGFLCAGSIRLGLYHKKTNELLSVFTLGKSRFDKNSDFELLRYCVKGQTVVVGGASKLMKHASKLIPVGSKIVSYSDLTWGFGNVYERLGFTRVGKIVPSYYYVSIKTGQILSRYQAQKQKLPHLLRDTFDSTLTESENLFKSGFRRIWNCGSVKWVLESQ